MKAAVFLAFYLLTYDLVKYPPGSETKEDFIMTIVMGWAFGILVHHLFTAERGMKEAAHDRFALLGRHASHIVHDIKGSISIPHMYLSEALGSLDKQDYAQTKEYLLKMGQSLSRTEKTVFVEVENPVEIWSLKIKNESSQKRNLSLFSYFEWCLGNATDTHREFQKTFIETEFDASSNVLFGRKRLALVPGFISTGLSEKPSGPRRC